MTPRYENKRTPGIQSATAIKGIVTCKNQALRMTVISLLYPLNETLFEVGRRQGHGKMGYESSNCVGLTSAKNIQHISCKSTPEHNSNTSYLYVFDLWSTHASQTQQIELSLCDDSRCLDTSTTISPTN